MAFVRGTSFTELPIARASCALHPRPLSHAAAKTALEEAIRESGTDTGTGDEARIQEMMTVSEAAADKQLQLVELEKAALRSKLQPCVLQARAG